MGILADYAEAIKRGLQNPGKVIEGNVNRLKDAVGLLPEDQKEEVERRFAICLDCPFNSINAVKAGFYETFREDLHCSICQCPLESKVRSFGSNCGLELLLHKETKQLVNNNGVMEEQVVTTGLHGYNKLLWTVYTPKE